MPACFMIWVMMLFGIHGFNARSEHVTSWSRFSSTHRTRSHIARRCNTLLRVFEACCLQLIHCQSVTQTATQSRTSMLVRWHIGRVQPCKTWGDIYSFLSTRRHSVTKWQVVEAEWQFIQKDTDLLPLPAGTHSTQDLPLTRFVVILLIFHLKFMNGICFICTRWYNSLLQKCTRAVQNSSDSSGLRACVCIFTVVMKIMCGMVLTPLGCSDAAVTKSALMLIAPEC